MAFACSLLVVATSLELLPHLVLYALSGDLLFGQVLPERWLILSLYTLGGILVRFVLLGCAYLVSHRIAFAVMRSFRSQICKKLARLTGPALGRYSEGDLKKILVDDVSRTEGLFAHFIPEFISALLVPIIASTLLFREDLRLGAIALALVPVALGIQAYTMRDFKSLYEEWHAAEQRANEGILEFIRGVVVLKAFNRDASSLSHLRDGVYGVRDLAIGMTKRTSYGYSSFFGLLSGNLLVILPGGLWLLHHDEIELSSLILLIILGTGLLVPLQRMLMLFGGLQQISTSFSRISNLLNAPEELAVPADRQPQPIGVALEMNGVSFQYENAVERVLDDVSLDFAPGTTNVIVGPSGSGKTTLLKLLMRRQSPDQGQIQLGGVDLADLAPSQLRGLFGYVSQDTTLFNDSIAANLRLARPTASDAELESALTQANALEFVEALDHGMNTVLGDRGHALSGGERQRMSIARAFLKDAPILLLDEIAANVDPRSERAISRAIRALGEDKTVVMIAHRIHGHTDVDQIIVMDQGRVVAKGRHEVLLGQCELYRRLWESQNKSRGWTMFSEAPCTT